MRRFAAIVVTVSLFTACRGSSSTSASTTPSPVAATGNGANARTATPAKPAAVTAANIVLGDSLFNTGSCQRCHGKGGVGAPNAPTLDGAKWVQLKTGSFDEIVAIITNGVSAEAIKDPSRKFPMRARGGPMNLTDPQVQAVAAYVYTLTHK